MATKKELEARIAALELEVNLLRAELAIQQRVIVQPVAPYQHSDLCDPYGWPQITSGTTTTNRFVATGNQVTP